MTSKERMLRALAREKPDRLPVTKEEARRSTGNTGPNRYAPKCRHRRCPDYPRDVGGGAGDVVVLYPDFR